MQTVRGVIANRKYRGDFVRFQYRAGKYHAIKDGEIVPRTKADRTEKVEPIVIEGNHKAVVEPEIFDKAQAKLARQRRNTAPRKAYQYILTGLLQCGDCGGPMGGKRSQSGDRKKIYRVYNCRRFQQEGRSVCYGNSIGEDRLVACI